MAQQARLDLDSSSYFYQDCLQRNNSFHCLVLVSDGMVCQLPEPLLCNHNVNRSDFAKIMACKSIDCSVDPRIFKLVKREVETWAALGEEQDTAEFSRDCAWNETTANMRLYMTYYEGGDLQNVLDSCRHDETRLHPLIATLWALEIASGVKACHERSIIHRDLKPSNGEVESLF